jgi:hypothetical protein
VNIMVRLAANLGMGSPRSLQTWSAGLAGRAEDGIQLVALLIAKRARRRVAQQQEQFGRLPELLDGIDGGVENHRPVIGERHGAIPAGAAVDGVAEPLVAGGSTG